MILKAISLQEIRRLVEITQRREKPHLERVMEVVVIGGVGSLRQPFNVVGIHELIGPHFRPGGLGGIPWSGYTGVEGGSLARDLRWGRLLMSKR